MARELYEIERVRVEVLLERGLFCDRTFFHAELFGQNFLDPLVHFLARRCHVTSLRWGR